MDAKKLEILMTAVDLRGFSRASRGGGLHAVRPDPSLVNSLERKLVFH